MNREEIHNKLEEIYTLLEDPNHWIQGKYAKTKDGIETTGSDPEACCWCLAGAIDKIAPNNRIIINVISFTCNHLYKIDFITFNDISYTLHEDVLDLIKDTQTTVKSLSDQELDKIIKYCE